MDGVLNIVKAAYWSRLPHQVCFHNALIQMVDILILFSCVFLLTHRAPLHLSLRLLLHSRHFLAHNLELLAFVFHCSLIFFQFLLLARQFLFSGVEGLLLFHKLLLFDRELLLHLPQLFLHFHELLAVLPGSLGFHQPPIELLVLAL